MKKMLCKLTNENNQTKNNTQWGENITHTTSGNGGLCSNGWIHYYDSPLLAVLLNPIHGNFKSPHLWKIKVEGKIKNDKGLKYGATSVTTIKKIPLPEITLEQKIIFGILCSMEIYKNDKFHEWGKHWIDGTDRSKKSAAAAYAAYAAAYAAADAAAAAYAAYAAADAAADAAYAAAYAADAAAYAAAYVIDLHAIALKAISYK